MHGLRRIHVELLDATMSKSFIGKMLLDSPMHPLCAGVQTGNLLHSNFERDPEGPIRGLSSRRLGSFIAEIV